MSDEQIIEDEEVTPAPENEVVDEAIDFDNNPAALAWLAKNKEALEKNTKKFSRDKDKAVKRAEKAEAELAALEAKYAALMEKVGTEGDYELEERLNKLQLFENEQLKAKDIDEDAILKRGREGAERKLQPQIEAKDKTIEELRAEIAKLKAENHEYRYTGKQKSLLNSLGVKPGYEGIALSGLREYSKIDDEGELIGVDPADNEIAYDTDGKPMSYNDFGKVFKKAFPDMFIKEKDLPSNGPGGSKTPNGAANPFAKETRNASQQAYLLAKDKDKARRLIKQAGKNPARYGL